MNTFVKSKNLTTILGSIFRTKHYNASVSYETQMNICTNYLYIYINIYSLLSSSKSHLFGVYYQFFAPRSLLSSSLCI